MKSLKLAMAALLATATGALASDEGTVVLDTNGDGVLTVEEVQTAFPEISVEGFSELDSNDDGLLDDAEVLAAQEAGHMKAPADG